VTAKQRRALHLADRKGGARVKLPGEKLADDQVSYQTAQVLIAKGWATLPKKMLLITGAGRNALNAPVFDDGLYLHAKMQRGYTTDPRQAASGEPQPMGEPSSTWKKAAEQAQAAAKTGTRAGRREQAKALAARARNSGRHGWRTTRPAAPVVSLREDPTVRRVVVDGKPEWEPIAEAA
jgi:hypothetical protein